MSEKIKLQLFMDGSLAMLGAAEARIVRCPQERQLEFSRKVLQLRQELLSSGSGTDNLCTLGQKVAHIAKEISIASKVEKAQILD